MIDRYVSHSMLTHSKVHCPFFSGCLKGGKKKERDAKHKQTKTDAKDPGQDSYSLPQRNQRATAQAPLGWLLPSLKCGRNSPPCRPLSLPPLSLSSILFPSKKNQHHEKWADKGNPGTTFLWTLSSFSYAGWSWKWNHSSKRDPSPSLIPLVNSGAGAPQSLHRKSDAFLHVSPSQC